MKYRTIEEKQKKLLRKSLSHQNNPVHK